nr:MULTISPECIES: helix-turn-helix domain-containing protein [unclassified Streptomyces]
MDFESREDRQPQGRKRHTAERAACFRLMQQGVSNTEACRIVGINRRTGKRRRYGRGTSGSNKAAPPITAVEPPSVPSRYLSEADRIHIDDRSREKATVRAIAAELGRGPNTVGREIRRNRHPGSGAYRPHAARARADARRRRPLRPVRPVRRRHARSRRHGGRGPGRAGPALTSSSPRSGCGRPWTTPG